jgi:hypothetical protein
MAALDGQLVVWMAGREGHLPFNPAIPESLAEPRESGNGGYACCIVRIEQSRNLRWCPIRVDDSTLTSILIYKINLFLQGVSL